MPSTRTHQLAAALSAALVLGLGCSEGAPTDPGTRALNDPGISLFSISHRIRMKDKCEQRSFNAAVGPGTCVGEGNVTFDQFIARLERMQEIEAWRFEPARFQVDAGETLAIVNQGGEVHTFTRVAKFGGGIVPDLNDLSGNPKVAPECTRLAPADFVAPGGRFRIATGPGGTLAPGRHRFECCIHPWMRSVAMVRTH